LAEATYDFEPLAVDDLAREFGGYTGPWWVVGGEALDLFVGRATRAHGDVDAEVLRRDAARVHAHLSSRGWRVHFAYDGKLPAWDDGREPIPQGCHGFWCRRSPTAAWAFDTKFAHSDGDDWLYRRDPRIRRPLATMTRRTPAGVPYVVPEVQLLFKAKDTRPKDDADFDTVLPRLDIGARRWLADALRRAHAGHPWIERLAEWEGDNG
jgi:hypothetical protein